VTTTIITIISTAALAIMMMTPCKFMIAERLRRERRRDRAALSAARQEATATGCDWRAVA